MTQAWIRLPEGEAASETLTAALERGADTFLPADDQDLDHLGTFREASVDDDGTLRLEGEPAGRRVTVEGKEAQSEAFEAVGTVDVLLVATPDWTVIPVENLIAEAQDTDTTLLAEVDTPEDAKLLLETLEVGVDGVVYDAQGPDDVLDLFEVLPEQTPTLDLATATVREVGPVGNGDRVCVDTTTLMTPGEGMLAGSAANALFLVHSESLESDYVASRPFRVNAGPVHAYTLRPDGSTSYLSELESGDEVLVVDEDGDTRPAVLGRVKIENRPLLLVEAEADGRTFTTLLQNAETIRLVTPDGPVAVTSLQDGDEVLVRLDTGGRHFGRAVDESIEER